MPNSGEGGRDLEYLFDRSPTARREPQLRTAALKQTERRAARHSFVRTRGADFILHLHVRAQDDQQRLRVIFIIIITIVDIHVSFAYSTPDEDKLGLARNFDRILRGG